MLAGRRIGDLTELLYYFRVYHIRDKVSTHARDARCALQPRAHWRTMVRLNDFQNLRQAARHLAPETELSDQEAFELIEREWRHLDLDTLSAEERNLLDRLTREQGNGVRLV